MNHLLGPLAYKIAEPTIEEILQRYLEDCEPTAIMRLLGEVQMKEISVDCLRQFLYHHGANYLNETERNRYLHFHEKSFAYRLSFQQIFGPVKLLAVLPAFFQYLAFELCLVASQKAICTICLTLADLCGWLASNELAPPEDCEQLAIQANLLSKQLPRAMRVAKRMVNELADCQMTSAEVFCDQPRRGLQRYYVARLSGHLMWLQDEVGTFVGPVKVGPKNRKDLEVGWEMHCALGRRRGNLELVLLGGIFPRPDLMQSW